MNHSPSSLCPGEDPNQHPCAAKSLSHPCPPSTFSVHSVTRPRAHPHPFSGCLCSESLRKFPDVSSQRQDSLLETDVPVPLAIPSPRETAAWDPHHHSPLRRLGERGVRLETAANTHVALTMCIHCPKGFAWTATIRNAGKNKPFNPHSNPVKYVLLSPFYR